MTFTFRKLYQSYCRRRTRLCVLSIKPLIQISLNPEPIASINALFLFGLTYATVLPVILGIRKSNFLIIKIIIFIFFKHSLKIFNYISTNFLFNEIYKNFKSFENILYKFLRIDFKKQIYSIYKYFIKILIKE